MSYRSDCPKSDITEAERKAIKERCKLWEQLREWYDKAEQLEEGGESEITVPIEIFLYAKQIPKSVEKFWKQVIVDRLRSG